MRKNVLDLSELLGYRLLSEEELSRATVTSVNIGCKTGRNEGQKPPGE